MLFLLLESLEPLSLSFFFFLVKNFVHAFADFYRFFKAFLRFVLFLSVIFVITVAHSISHFFIIFNNFLKLQINFLFQSETESTPNDKFKHKVETKIVEKESEDFTEAYFVHAQTNYDEDDESKEYDHAEFKVV